MRFCPYCRAEVNDFDSECEYCGAELPLDEKAALIIEKIEMCCVEDVETSSDECKSVGVR